MYKSIFAHVQILYVFKTNNGTTIHTAAKSHIAYKFADRYLGISPTTHVALQLYELVFYTKSNQNLIAQISTLLRAFTKKYIIKKKNGAI